MTTDDNLWKRKLLAYLHDPPCKALDIGRHEEIAKSFIMAEFGELDESDRSVKAADRLAASIDRFPFPQKKAAAEFNGKEGGSFRHPFMNSDENWYEIKSLKSVELYEEALHDAVRSIEGSYKEKFFLYWRRWRDEATKKDKYPELAFFPADTRIPDHSIWTHLDITAALEGCRNPETDQIEPAFLIFQAGPVQSFVAAARSTRDLWSGSYMLSWLTGNAIKAVTDVCGPDSIIFPSLRGNGIFDILNRDIYDKVSFNGKDGKKESLWDRIYGTSDAAKVLTNPTLPNRFFAVVPKWRAEELARKAEKAFRDELERISEHCLKRFEKLAKDKDIPFEEGWRTRWRNQVRLHSDITWQCLPVDDSLDSILKDTERLPGQEAENSQRSIVERMMKFAQKEMPMDDRDGRYYTDTSKTKLSSWGIAWSLNYGRTEFFHAARRNTRDFDAFVTDENQAGALKDALTGVEEVIGSEDLWEKLRAPKDKPKDYVNYFFEDNEKAYGAMNIIKRLWCSGDGNYISGKLGVSWDRLKSTISFDSVPDVAKNNRRANSPYVAVIALDGDEMGKWMSGEKAPELKNLLAGNAVKYFIDNKLDGLKRALTPSWHLQFSEALSNVANRIAGKVVERYEGQLIYAGGDDVLAMLPADRAIECACALRGLFRGDWDYLEATAHDCKGLYLASTQKGFVNSDDGTFLVPGCNADVSCGIAIAHCNYPLQSIVNEARSAESRAKNELDRGAMAVSLLKRSGEIIHWGAKWDIGAVELYNKYVALRENEGEDAAGKRFPYALSALLANYSLEDGEFVTGFDAKAVILCEFDHVMKQQMANVKPEDKEEFRKLAESYLNKLVEQLPKRNGALADFANLFLVAAFSERNREEM